MYAQTPCALHALRSLLLFEETMNTTNHIFLGITEILTGLGSHYSQALRKCKQEEDSFETFISFETFLTPFHLRLCVFCIFCISRGDEEKPENTSENQKTLMQNSRLSCATVRTARTYEFTRL